MLGDLTNRIWTKIVDGADHTPINVLLPGQTEELISNKYIQLWQNAHVTPVHHMELKVEQEVRGTVREKGREGGYEFGENKQGTLGGSDNNISAQLKKRKEKRRII